MRAYALPMSTPDVRAGGEDPLDAAARELRERLEAKASEHEETRSREDFRAEVTRLDRLTQDFVSTLRAAWMMFTRYPHSDDWLLQRSTDDLLESAISIVMLAREGVFNVGRRELRYMLEATVKYVYVDQRLPGDASLAERVSMLGNTAIVHDRQSRRSTTWPYDSSTRRCFAPR